jgi:teichuronic acid biosynthesis glycosyltransferase TuaC
MRVLVISNMFPREDDPSYGVFVAEQLDALRAAGLEADRYFIEGFRSRLEYVKAVAALKKARRRYDVFHAHHTLTTLAALLAGVRPLVATVHEGAVAKNPRYRRFARAVASRADRVVAVSAAIARTLRPLACDVIPIGVDLSVFRPRDRAACRRELGLDAGPAYVLFPADPGRPEKRYDLAVAALALARENDSSLELLTLPPSSRAQVAAYFGAADVALVTSDFESGPLTVKEAVACGRPVVSRRVGDVDFLARCDGCFVVGDDARAIADGIVAAAGQNEVDAAAVREYELRTVTHRLANLYREVVRNGEVL